MSSAEEVLSKHKKTSKAMLELQKSTDPKTLLDGAAKIAEMGKELEAAGARLEAEFAGISGPEETVILTPDQRERLAESTGVAMEKLVVIDKDGSFARKMPTTDRATIERMAARQAAEIAVKKARDEAIEKLIKSLEKLNMPEVMDPIIAAIRKDPTLKELAKQQMEAGEALKAKHADDKVPEPPGEG